MIFICDATCFFRNNQNNYHIFERHIYVFIKMKVYAHPTKINKMTVLSPDEIYCTMTHLFKWRIFINNDIYMDYSLSYNNDLRCIKMRDFGSNAIISYDEIWHYSSVEDDYYYDFPNLANPEGLHGYPWVF